METITTLRNKLTQLLVFAYAIFTYNVYAQSDSGVTEVSTNVTSKTTTTTEWYANPTYLAIGALVVIIIVILLARSGRRNRD